MHATELTYLPALIFMGPFLAYYWAFSSILSTWAWYVFLFPVVLNIFPFYLHKKIKKIPLIFLPFLVFLILQIVPLPRSAIHIEGGGEGPPGRNEPVAVGFGYPYAYLKLFLGNGWEQKDTGTFYKLYSFSNTSDSNAKSQAIHIGDVVFLPDLMIYQLWWIGFLFYSYVIFLFILLIKSGVNQEKRAKRLAEKKKKLSKS